MKKHILMILCIITFGACEESEKMTKAILNWECDVNLEGLAFGNYTPIDQMLSMNLMIGQMTSGVSAQPFKTVEAYKNWITSQN